MVTDEEREGTNCENLPETHVFLKKLRAYVDSKYKGKLLLAEGKHVAGGFCELLW